MTQPRSWLPGLGVESLVVVFSILAALAADEWWQGRETRAAVSSSLEAIRAEVAANRERLAQVAPYHRKLADTLLALASVGTDRPDPTLHSQGWLQTPELTMAAWEGARATGTTAAMSPEVVGTLADVYGRQAQYLARREAIIPVLYEWILDAGDPDLAEAYEPLAGIISDVASWEALLLEWYERVLVDWPGGAAP